MQNYYKFCSLTILFLKEIRKFKLNRGNYRIDQIDLQ